MFELRGEEQQQAAGVRMDVAVRAVLQIEPQRPAVGFPPVFVEIEHRRDHPRVGVAQAVEVPCVTGAGPVHRVVRLALDQAQHQFAVERDAQRVDALGKRLLRRAHGAGDKPVRAVATQRRGSMRGAGARRQQQLRVVHRRAFTGQRPGRRGGHQAGLHAPAVGGERARRGLEIEPVGGHLAPWNARNRGGADPVRAIGGRR